MVGWLDLCGCLVRRLAGSVAGYGAGLLYRWLAACCDSMTVWLADSVAG